MKLIDSDFYKYDAEGSGFNSIMLLTGEDPDGNLHYSWFFTLDAHKANHKETLMYAESPGRIWMTRRPTSQYLALKFLEANTPMCKD